MESPIFYDGFMTEKSISRLAEHQKGWLLDYAGDQFYRAKKVSLVKYFTEEKIVVDFDYFLYFDSKNIDRYK